jgi:hypothetical protein
MADASDKRERDLRAELVARKERYKQLEMELGTTGSVRDSAETFVTQATIEPRWPARWGLSPSPLSSFVQR